MATACRSTSPQGIDHRLPPMRLWHKAKRLGTWDPCDVDLARDEEDWKRLDGDQRDVLLRLEFADFALSQFGRRVARLEKARGQTLADVLGTPPETEEAGG